MHSNETVAAQSPTGTRRDRRQVKALTQERSASYLRKIPGGKKKEEKPKEKTNSRRHILTLKKPHYKLFSKRK